MREEQTDRALINVLYCKSQLVSLSKVRLGSRVLAGRLGSSRDARTNDCQSLRLKKTLTPPLQSQVPAILSSAAAAAIDVVVVVLMQKRHLLVTCT